MNTALVIGAGGVAGLAWSCGTLAAVETAQGWDPRSADALIGTSQGALLAGLLASGIGTEELVRWYRKQLPDPHPLRSRVRRPAAGAAPRRRVPTPASPKLLARVVGREAIHPVTALSGLLPSGRGSLDGFLAPLAAVVGDRDWVPHPATEVVAVDYDSGRRVAFGRGQSRPPVLEAVRASCTVPGGFPPVVIDGRRYVDGAAHSTTNADLALDAGGEKVDEVVVLAPMAGEAGIVQRWVQRQLRAECRRLAKAGIEVRVLTPSHADRSVMLANRRDPAQRFAIFEAALASGPERVAAAYG